MLRLATASSLPTFRRLTLASLSTYLVRVATAAGAITQRVVRN